MDFRHTVFFSMDFSFDYNLLIAYLFQETPYLFIGFAFLPL